jgi:hypothetical protein
MDEFSAKRRCRIRLSAHPRQVIMIHHNKLKKLPGVSENFTGTVIDIHFGKRLSGAFIWDERDTS